MWVWVWVWVYVCMRVKWIDGEACTRACTIHHRSFPPYQIDPPIDPPTTPQLMEEFRAAVVEAERRLLDMVRGPMGWSVGGVWCVLACLLGVGVSPCSFYSLLWPSASHLMISNCLSQQLSPRPPQSTTNNHYQPPSP